jgi:hypothetical protein
MFEGPSAHQHEGLHAVEDHVGQIRADGESGSFAGTETWRLSSNDLPRPASRFVESSTAGPRAREVLDRHEQPWKDKSETGIAVSRVESNEDQLRSSEASNQFVDEIFAAIAEWLEI